MFAEFRPDEHGTDIDATVRPMSEGDVEDCARISALRDGGSEQHHRDALARALSRADRDLLAAVLDGKIVGHASSGYLTPVADGGHDAPDGWYLTGIVVAPEFRRCGIGRTLTRARLDRLDEHTEVVRYFCTAVNATSLRLHTEFGFREANRDVAIAGVTFTGGVGVLCERVRGADRQPSRTEIRS